MKNNIKDYTMEYSKKEFERLKLVWTLVLLNVHTSISSLFREGIFDYHWTWILYPKTSVRYFSKKYGSIMNAKNVLL